MAYHALSGAFYQDKDKYNQLYEQRYNSESTYRFNFDIKGNNAFVVIQNDILKVITDIYEVNEELAILSSQLPKEALSQYTNRCLVDEIRLTNEIEGVHSTRREISEIVSDKYEKLKNRRLYTLTKKYQLLTDTEIELKTCQDIRDLYDGLVLKEVEEEDKNNHPDGTIFRKETVYVQNATGDAIHTGIHPEEEIIKVMSKCLDMLNNNEYDYLIRIAVFHYAFGYIHPFYDGNGRTSRFISSYLLSNKLNKLVAYRLSYTIKENLQSYYKSFKVTNDIKNKGDLTLFVLSFLSIIKKDMEELYINLDERRTKFNYLIHIADILDLDKKTIDVLKILIQNTLFSETGLTANQIAEDSIAAITKVRACVKTLENAGLVTSHKESRSLIYKVDIDKLTSYED